jgi:SAM-dependent methyltransferase
MLIGTLWYFIITFIEFLFIINKPKVWRYYFYFKLEYFFYSPYHYANKKEFDDFVFGFTTLFSFYSVFNKAKKLFQEKSKSKEIYFCDAGCGDGRGVFLVNLLYDIKVCGIEINKDFLDKMMILKISLLRKNIQSAKKIMIVDENIFNYEFTDYGIIFITWTTYKKDTEIKLTKKLEKEVAKDSIIITLSYPINSEFFEVLGEKNIIVSWGFSTAFFHRKVKE